MSEKYKKADNNNVGQMSILNTRHSGGLSGGRFKFSYLYFIIIIILGSGCNNPSEIESCRVSYQNDNKIDSITTIYKNKKQGFSCELYKSGIPLSIVNYDKGEKNGPSHLFYKNGKYKQFVSWVDGQRQGESFLYSINGALTRYYYYKNDSAYFGCEYDTNGYSNWKGYEIIRLRPKNLVNRKGNKITLSLELVTPLKTIRYLEVEEYNDKQFLQKHKNKIDSIFNKFDFYVLDETNNIKVKYMIFNDNTRIGHGGILNLKVQ